MNKQRQARLTRKVCYAVVEYFNPKMTLLRGPDTVTGPVWVSSRADMARYLSSLDPAVLDRALGTLERSGRLHHSRARVIRQEFVR